MYFVGLYCIMSKRWRSFERHNSRTHVAMLSEISVKPLWLLPGHHYKNGENTV